MRRWSRKMAGLISESDHPTEIGKIPKKEKSTHSDLQGETDEQDSEQQQEQDDLEAKSCHPPCMTISLRVPQKN